MTSTRANDRQVGGDHYQKKEYQHWDWVCDINLHYLLACATKYVARWRDKNGVQDLEKSVHYLEKAMERRVPDRHGYEDSPRYENFYRQLPDKEAEIVRLIIMGAYQSAVTRIELLIAAEQAESATESPTPASPA